jgi:hypothetical protein
MSECEKYVDLDPHEKYVNLDPHEKYVNLDPHDKECNFNISDHVTQIYMKNVHLNKEMKELLSHLDCVDLNRPMFQYNTCALWNGEIKQKGIYKQPYCPYLPVSRSVIRFIYEQVYCVKLIKPKDVLRHMCPLITGQFNSGLCCNPLHLRLGTTKENMRDIHVHDLVKKLISDPHQTDFCFQHNSGMTTTTIQTLLPEELEQIKHVASIHKLPNPMFKCCCNIIQVSVPKRQRIQCDIEPPERINSPIKPDIMILTLPKNRPKVLSCEESILLQ